MPELSDVEGFKRYANRHVRGARVESVHVSDEQVLEGTTPQGLGRALHGRTLLDHRRRGKWLLGATDGPTVLFNFGMTGYLRFSSRPDQQEEHDRVRFGLDRGHLTYGSQRKLGRVALVTQGSAIEEVTGDLGPDADEVGVQELAELLRDRRGHLKSTLMNQSAIAGLGNELSDEILWRARLHPDRRAGDLSDEELHDLHGAMSEVLAESKRHGRIPEGPGWLESVRGESDPRCPRCGAPVDVITSAGRTAYVCSKEQR